MISVSQAEKIIQSQFIDLGNESVSYTKLSGRVLAEDICAKRPQPPFDRVTMDGIAITSKDWKTAETVFKRQARQCAGESALTLQSGYCIEIMTGAVLPSNADCIVPVEQITHIDKNRTNKGYQIHAEYAKAELIKSGRNIHHQGSDHNANEVLISANTPLNATHIACLLSAGHAQAQVKRSPRIRIIMSGDELIAAGKAIKDYQIYASNAPALEALLNTHGYSHTQSVLLGDDLDALQAAISEALRHSDILITTGGVSMGKKDLLPIAFEKLGIECHFHKVTQKPGKPLWFGSHQNGLKKTLTFALPGNPVSALVTARRYIIPALNQMSGLGKKSHSVQLSDDVSFKPNLSYFLPVKISQNENALFAKPLAFNTSGDTVSLTQSDGFVELDAARTAFKKGELVEYFAW